MSSILNTPLRTQLLSVEELSRFVALELILFGFSVSARSCRGLDSSGSSTPPQARQRGRRKTEARCELPELVDTQCLREYVSNLEVRTDVVKINFPSLNAFADEVIVHFNVFSPGMKHGVASEVDAAYVVVDIDIRLSCDSQ